MMTRGFGCSQQNADVGHPLPGGSVPPSGGRRITDPAGAGQGGALCAFATNTRVQEQDHNFHPTPRCHSEERRPRSGRSDEACPERSRRESRSSLQNDSALTFRAGFAAFGGSLRTTGEHQRPQETRTSRPRCRAGGDARPPRERGRPVRAAGRAGTPALPGSVDVPSALPGGRGRPLRAEICVETRIDRIADSLHHGGRGALWRRHA